MGDIEIVLPILPVAAFLQPKPEARHEKAPKIQVDYPGVRKAGAFGGGSLDMEVGVRTDVSRV